DQVVGQVAVGRVDPDAMEAERATGDVHGGHPAQRGVALDPDRAAGPGLHFIDDPLDDAHRDDYPRMGGRCQGPETTGPDRAMASEVEVVRGPPPSPAPPRPRGPWYRAFP